MLGAIGHTCAGPLAARASSCAVNERADCAGVAWGLTACGEATSFQVGSAVSGKRSELGLPVSGGRAMAGEPAGLAPPSLRPCEAGPTGGAFFRP